MFPLRGNHPRPFFRFPGNGVRTRFRFRIRKTRLPVTVPGKGANTFCSLSVLKFSLIFIIFSVNQHISNSFLSSMTGILSL